MRILIPSRSFFPAQEGGPSNALYWLASGLASAGYKVRVVTTNRYIDDPALTLDRWVNVNGFDVIYTTNEKARDSFLKEELMSCDTVIANGLCSISNLLFNVKALFYGKKLLISPRGELLESAIFHRGLTYGCMKVLAFVLMRFVYGKRVLFHATSRDEFYAIKKYMGKHARVLEVPNYMILPERVLFETSVDRDYLLYVGRITPLKNLEIMIDAVAMSGAFMNSGLKLYIAGEKKGAYYEALVNKVECLGLSEKVVFLGMVTGKEKDMLYAKAKVLLLISKSENFGNVVVEALSQGTPVIASSGTPWKYLNDKKAGYWVRAEREAVSDKIDTLLSMQDNEYETMRMNAYSFSRDFDVFSNMEKWDKALSNL